MRQRARAIPTAPPTRPIRIGIQMARTGEPTAPQAFVAPVETTTPGVAISVGPLIDITDRWCGDTEAVCSWLVLVHGVAAGQYVEWAAAWDDMETSPDAVEFDPSLDDASIPQVIQCFTGSVANLIVYATVEGVVYESAPVSCLV